MHKLFVYRDEVKRYNEWYEYPGYEFVEMEDTGSVNISESTESIDNPEKDVQNKETSNAEGQVMEEIVVEAAAVSTTKNNDNHETTISENNNNYDIIDVDGSNDDGNFDDSNDANGNMNVSTSLTTTNTTTTRNKTIVNNKNSKLIMIQL